MLRWLIATTLALVVGQANARPADCLLVVDQKTRIDGVCDFQPNPDGFQILSIARPLIFADVQRTSSLSAFGNWNEEPGSTHAHSSLGELRRDGACWINDRARVCAWKIGEPRSYTSRNEIGDGSPDFIGRDRAWAGFKTRIRDGMAAGPNFAHTMRVITIGCGTGCRIHPVVSLRTGQVFSFPIGGEDYQMLDLSFSLGSPEVSAKWMDGATCMSQSFSWTGNGFTSGPARMVTCPLPN